MERWEAIRKLARNMRVELRPRTSDDSARALLFEAERATGIKPRPVRSNDPLLCGASATFDPDTQSIWYNKDLDPGLLIIYLSHEYGHFWIDGYKSFCNQDDLDLEPAEDGGKIGANKVEGYSPVEHRELQANVFSREFLLPATDLRKWYKEDHLNVTEIATRVGVPEAFVITQLAFALLIPASLQSVTTPPTNNPTEIKGLDPDQQQAAHDPRGPLLVEAGPGTGKTRTLVGRIHFLVQSQHVEPEKILVLTFSNRAAAEMRERVTKTLSSDAVKIWMGTFHSFGLELLRKFGDRIGLPSNPRVIDDVAALFLLERLLPVLHLQYYQNLFDPVLSLRDILRAISRAKDELADPERYTELALKMRETAKEPEDIESAEKALEVARVYGIYQHQLKEEGLLDYGDLIAKSVHLLEQFPDVKQLIQADFPHILVDEYQDVNRACAQLLKHLAGAGEGLWVVGNIHQSIYRFRGAAPYNIRAFAEDFTGGRTLPLGWNYRSQPTILTVLNCLAPRMRATREAQFKPWNNHRQDEGGKVLMGNAENQAAEGKGLAREIQFQHIHGIPYHDQAVLCRSHGELNRIGMLLEEEGIPILYLGDLFERPEIRDLLALVSIATGPDGIGLWRVGRFPEYDIPQADILTLISAADDQQVPFPRALSLVNELSSISSQGRSGLTLLKKHLQGLTFKTQARWLLARYLFERSRYLVPLLMDESNKAQQQRLAIFQLLEYAGGYDSNLTGNEDSKKTFLENIRRIEVLGEEKQLSQLPEMGLAMDAVRLLTIHASKGLEFRAIYLPNLAKGSFPMTRGRRSMCPPPPGLIPWAGDDEEMEEEECLFFVALSRAKDFLCLSRPCRIRNRSSNPSDFFDLISEALPQLPTGPITWQADEPEQPAESNSGVQPAELPIYDQEALDRYIRCPKGYYFRIVLGLKGSKEDSAYLRLHRCLREVIYWAEEKGAAGVAINETTLLEKLDTTWADNGPVDHPFELVYRENANAMVLNAIRKGLISEHPENRTAVEVSLDYGRVRFIPDHLEISQNKTRIFRRMKTGRVRSKDDDPVYGLYFAAGNDGSGTPFRIEVASLLTGEVISITLNAKTAATRTGRYMKAMRGIQEEDFHPYPQDDRDCPRCSYYFICSPASNED